MLEKNNRKYLVYLQKVASYINYTQANRVNIFSNCLEFSDEMGGSNYPNENV